MASARKCFAHVGRDRLSHINGVRAKLLYHYFIGQPGAATGLPRSRGPESVAARRASIAFSAKIAADPAITVGSDYPRVAAGRVRAKPPQCATTSIVRV